MDPEFTEPVPNPGAVIVITIRFSFRLSSTILPNLSMNLSMYSYDAPSGAVAFIRNQLLSSRGANSEGVLSQAIAPIANETPIITNAIHRLFRNFPRELE